MQTLEALLAKKLPDDYMETYKKVIHSKNVGSESDKCEEPMKNGVEPVLTSLVTKATLSKSRPVIVGESTISKATTNGLKGNGTYRLIARGPFPSEVANTRLSNGSVQFKSVTGSVTYGNGTIRVLPGLNGISKDEVLFKTPNSVPNTGIRKKFRMSTVAKQVPLINTVGNQSKLYPIPGISQSQAPHVTSINSSTALEASVPTLPQVTEGSKTMSILEARLTSPASNFPTTPVSNSENQLPVCNGLESVLTSKENGVAETVGSGSTESVKPKAFCFDKRVENLNPNKGKVVLSFERGLIRLAAIQSRTVKMVDVGMQVCLPNAEEQALKSSDTCPQTHIPSQQAFSSELSGSVQPAAAAAAAVTSTEPIIRKPFVVVDIKDGKKVLAISKKLLTNYCGPKTFIIDGKAVKRKPETSVDFLLNGFENLTTVESSDLIKCQQQQREFTTIHTKTSHIVSSNLRNLSPDSLLGHNDLVTVVSSLSSDTMTTSSSQGRQSITSPILTSNSSPCSVGNISTLSNNSFNLSSVKAVANSNASDSMVLNSAFKLDGGYLVKDSSHSPKFISLSPSCVAPMSNKADSVILPLNSTVKTSSLAKSSDSTSIRTLPNTSSVFILVPNSMNQAPACPDSEPVLVDNQIGEIQGMKTYCVKRKNDVASVDCPPLKKKCTEPRSFTNAAVDLQCVENGCTSSFVNSSKPITNGFSNQANGAGDVRIKNSDQTSSETGGNVSSNSSVRHSHGPVMNRSNSVGSSNLNEAPINVSKEEVDKFVKSAFMEFKNCLVFDLDGKLPIHSAVERNDYASVNRQCIVLKARRSSVNIPNSKDETPLQLALYYGYSSIAQLLLKHGADAKVVDHDGNSSLHLAVMYAEDALVGLLLFGQLNERFIDRFNDEGFSALHLAAQRDKVNAIGWLAESGAAVDLPDGKSGRTALFHAIERKNYGAQKALLSFGADIKEPTFAGSTPFLLTKSDAIAQLTGNRNAVAEIIDSETLLQSTRRSRFSKVK